MNSTTIQLVVDKHIRLAPEEDISSEDVPTNSVTLEHKKGEVQLICREDSIIAGLQILERVFTSLDSETRVVFDVRDGEGVKKGQHLATVTGDVCVLPSGKRTALSYLQRLSGIAIYTRTVAGILEGTGVRLLDTRKIIPCMCIFEKYAVRIEDGQNHRYNLSGDVLLKDNHIDAAGGVREAVIAAKAYAPSACRIEVGTKNLDMVKEAMDAGADIITPDNIMSEQMTEVIRYVDGRVETECFGSMTKENIRTVTELGVDYVFSGALTHSSPTPDISLRRLKVLTDQTVAMFCRRE